MKRQWKAGPSLFGMLLLGVLAVFPSPAAAQIGGNRPPIANAGPDRALGIGALGLAGFTLNGSASFDPNGDALSYRWYDFNGNLLGTSASLSLQRAAGSHVFTLVVDDNKTGTGSDSVLIIILLDTTPPLVLPPGDITVSASETGGARASSSPQLAAFLAGAIAVDDFDDVPTSLSPTAGGVDVDSNTLFPLNSTTGVTFFFTDYAGNIGRAVSNLTVVDLRDNDILIGAEIAALTGEGQIHHIRGTTETTWCQSVSVYYPDDHWGPPRDVLVDSQGRVVFISDKSNAWGLFRCNAPGLPAEKLALFPRYANVTYPGFPVPYPGNLYSTLSGLHLARNRSIVIDDNVNNGLPKVLTEDAYVFSVETTTTPNTGAHDPPTAVRYRVASDKWEPGPAIVQDLVLGGGSGILHASNPDLVFHKGATYSAGGPTLGRDKDPFHLEVTAHIGSLTLGLSVNMFGGYSQIPQAGAVYAATIAVDDLSIPNVPSGCNPQPPISNSWPQLSSGGVAAMDGFHTVVYDTAGLGLVLETLSIIPNTPYLTNVSEALLDKPGDPAEYFQNPLGSCIAQPSLKFTSIMPYWDPNGSGGNGTLFGSGLAAAPSGLVGIRTSGYGPREVVHVTSSGMQTIVVSPTASAITAWPPSASPGSGVVLVIRIDSPVDVLLTDANGKKLGIENGQPINDFGSDGFDSGPNSHPHFYAIQNPAAGNFALSSIGTGTGPFTVHVYTADLDKPLGEHIAQTGDAFSGSTAKHDFTLATGGKIAFANQVPIANPGADQTVDADSSGNATVQLDGSASSDPDNDALTFLWAGPVGSLSGAQPSVTLPVGIHSLTLSVADGKGGTADAKVIITVNAFTSPPDTTPPVLFLPANIVVPATSAFGAAVTFSASATDDVDGPVPVTCLPASGSTFVIGTTTVNCSASDLGNNSASGSFSVTVNLGTPRIAGTLVARGSDALGNRYFEVRLTNTGTGHARNLKISQLLLRTLSGSGIVTYLPALSGALPLAIGSLDVSASTTVRLYLSVPSTVTRFSITETGTVNNVTGTLYSYSTAQSVIP